MSRILGYVKALDSILSVSGEIWDEGLSTWRSTPRDERNMHEAAETSLLLSAHLAVPAGIQYNIHPQDP